ncbi:MAG: thiamine-phosphate kinase [Gammaproteobacteria bacterium]
MSVSEFNLIAHYFADRGVRRDDVAHGIGDDAALLRVPDGMDLVVAVDTLVAGVHFPVDTDAAAIGHKALAVNLSDLAAMGAEPAWATLALTVPDTNAQWLDDFSRGLFALAEQHGVQLVGGDTTRGPLTITVQAHGFVPRGQALRRAGAQPGDLVYVTGTLGDAGLALLALQEAVRLPIKDKNHVLQRLNYPEPRVAVGQALRSVASAAIDVSDGLAADLNHILAASRVGATIQIERLPLSDVVQAHFHTIGEWIVPLASGDDYELIITVPAARQADLEQACAAAACRCTWIGSINARPGLHCLMDDGSEIAAPSGYQHFTAS